MGLLVIKRGKIVKMEGILLQDGQEVKGFDDSGYKYIGILEKDQLKEKETFAAQEQALKTSYVKFNRDKSVDSPLCSLCGQKGETINYIIGECKSLT